MSSIHDRIELNGWPSELKNRLKSIVNSCRKVYVQSWRLSALSVLLTRQFYIKIISAKNHECRFQKSIIVFVYCNPLPIYGEMFMSSLEAFSGLLMSQFYIQIISAKNHESRFQKSIIVFYEENQIWLLLLPYLGTY